MLVLQPTIDTLGRQLINASFTKGDVIGWTFQIKIDDTPLNLTSATLKMTIGTSTPVIKSTANGGITITNAALGQFIVNISSSETASYEAGTYPYDVWYQQSIAPPNETQYITGNLTVNESVSVFP